MDHLLAVLAALAFVAPSTAEAPPDTSALVRGNTRFALELYGQLRQKEGNLFLSPFSVSTALAMTSAGARDRTLEQMQAALHLPPQKELHRANAALLRQVNGDGKQRGYQLSTANSLWCQKGHPFRPTFLALNKGHYGAGLFQADFATDAEAARRAINAWVEKETRGRIKNLLTPGTIDDLTRLVLTNAIYFKGDWANSFRKDHTRPGDFRTPEGRIVKAALMAQTATFPYHDGGTFQALEMPYHGKELSLVTLLPKKANGLPALEKALTPKALAGWLKQLSPCEVDVRFPRFRVTTGFQLKSALAALGMPLAFTTAADFSGMSQDGERLHLSAVVHKAFVEVNEQGTEAAAATAVVVAKTVEKPPPPVVFRADRPFVFLIRDRRSGSLLFLGRLVNPS